MDFGAFFEKKTKKTKNEKVGFDCEKPYYREGRHVKKKEGRLEKSDEKNIEVLIKNRGKIDGKVACSALLNKNRENHCTGTPISPQSRIFGGFGGPLGSQKSSPRGD